MRWYPFLFLVACGAGADASRTDTDADSDADTDSDTDSDVACFSEVDFDGFVASFDDGTGIEATVEIYPQDALGTPGDTFQSDALGVFSGTSLVNCVPFAARTLGAPDLTPTTVFHLVAAREDPTSIEVLAVPMKSPPAAVHVVAGRSRTQTIELAKGIGILFPLSGADGFMAVNGQKSLLLVRKP